MRTGFTNNTDFLLIGNPALGLTVSSFQPGVWDSVTSLVDTSTPVGTLDNLAKAIQAIAPVPDAVNNMGAITTVPGGYWQFSEPSGTAVTNSGNQSGFDGTCVGGVTRGVPGPTGAFGSPNNAVTFDGASGMMTTGLNYLNNRGAFTMAGWIKPSVQTISRVGLFGQNDAVEFGFIDPNTLQVWTAGGGSLSVAYPFARNEWHHVAVVGNGTNLLMYFDGNLAGTGGSATGSYGSSADHFNIGGAIFDPVGATANWYTGSMDEVAAFPSALSAADIALLGARSPKLTLWTQEGFPSTVNFVNTGPGAHFAVGGATANVNMPDQPFPGLPSGAADTDDYVTEARGLVTIPTSGNWSFGVNSDEGFSLTLTVPGQSVPVASMSVPGLRSPGNTIQGFSLSAGVYELRLLTFDRTLGSEVELFAGSGSYTAWSGTGGPVDPVATWHLVGDTAHGGLPVSPWLPVPNLATADQVVAGQLASAWTSTATVPTVNLYNTGPGGVFGSDQTFPGLTVGTGANDFVVQAKATIDIPTAGNWTFGVNSDDGFRLVLEGPIGSNDPAGTPYTAGALGGMGVPGDLPATMPYQKYYMLSSVTGAAPADTLRTFTLPAAGVYNVTLVYFQRSAGASLELYAQAGTFATYAAGGAGWRLVGDTANGGLVMWRQGQDVVTDLATAENVTHGDLNSTVSTASAIAPVINLMNTGTEGHFAPNQTFPGYTIGTEAVNFVTEVTGIVRFPTSGAWTLGVNTQKAFSLNLTGQTPYSSSNTVYADTLTFAGTGNATPADTLRTFTIPVAGDYELRLLAINNNLTNAGASISGTDEIELYAQSGTIANYAAGGTAWRLIGDASNGGLAVGAARLGLNTTVYKANTGTAIGTLGSVANALTLIANPAYQSWTYNEISPYINFENTAYSAGLAGGAGSRFYSGAPTPALNVADRAFAPQAPIGTDINDFAVQSTGQIYIPQTGNWTFGVNSDDGFRLWIQGEGQNFDSGAVGTRSGADSLYTWSFTNVGWYDIRLVYFERSGGGHEELYACQGSLPVGAFLGPNNLPLAPFPTDTVGTTNQNIAGVPNPGGIATPLGYYPLVGGGSYQWRLVGDVAHGGLRVVYPQPTIGNIAQDAERTIGSIINSSNIAAQYQVTRASAVAPYVNYLDTGSTAVPHYDASKASPSNIADVAYPGLTSGLDNYVGVATGTVVIPAGTAPNNYTFGVNSHEGFKLTITGQTFSSVTGGSIGPTADTMYYGTNRAPADTLGVVTFPAAGGTFSFRLEWYSNVGGSEAELYAQSGSFTTWAAGGTNWHLVGDTANGGLAVPGNWAGGWATAITKANVAVSSLAAADTVLGTPGQQTWTKTEQVAYINYVTTGADGHFYSSAASPGNVANKDIPGSNNDFVTQIQTQVYIPDFENYVAVSSTAASAIAITAPQAGAWTFAVNTDEAYKLTVTGTGGGSVTWPNPAAVKQPTDSFQHFTLSAGTYSVSLEWLNNTGGSNIELYAVQANVSSWANAAGTAYAWALVGDTANGGLGVTGGWSTTVYKAEYGRTVTTIAQADTLIITPSQQMWTQTETAAPYINYQTTGINDPQGVMDGHFFSGNLLPGNVANRMVPGGNQYTFGVSSDEGFSFRIANPRSGGGAPSPTTFGVDGTRQAGDTLQTITFAEPGLYNVRIVTFDRRDGAETELFAAPGSLSTFTAAQFRLVGDTADGGLLATLPSDPYIMNVNAAETMVSNNTSTGGGQVVWNDRSATSYQSWTAQAATPFLNYQLTGPAGHFTGPQFSTYFDQAFPSPLGANGEPIMQRGTESDDFAVVARTNIQIPAFSLTDYVGNATATITVPAAGGTYTFGVTTDEGFRLTLGGGLAFSSVTGGTIVTKTTANDSITAVKSGTPADTFGVVTFPVTANPTNYTVQLEWFNHTSSSMIELYSAPGTFTTWIDSNAWALVGNTANGGFPVTGNGWTTQIYKANVSVTTMALADTVLATPSQQTWNKGENAALRQLQGRRPRRLLLHRGDLAVQHRQPVGPRGGRVDLRRQQRRGLPPDAHRLRPDVRLRVCRAAGLGRHVRHVQLPAIRGVQHDADLLPARRQHRPGTLRHPRPVHRLWPRKRRAQQHQRVEAGGRQRRARRADGEFRPVGLRDADRRRRRHCESSSGLQRVRRPDPTAGATGTNVYGYNLNGDYVLLLASPEYLTSTAVNCTGKYGVTVRYMQWLGVEQNANGSHTAGDQAGVQVSNDGVNWTTIWANPTLSDYSAGGYSNTGWVPMEADISAYANNQATVYVRFQMAPSNSFGQYNGWNIDDVQFLGFPTGPAPTITSISQSSARSNRTILNMVVSGTEFRPGTQVRLVRSDMPDYVIKADGAAVVTQALCGINPTQMVFDLNLNAMTRISDGAFVPVQSGYWDVQVVEADGQVATLIKGLLINGTVYYVNDSSLAFDAYCYAGPLGSGLGNDANDGLSPQTPKASVQSVLSTYALQPGDLVLIDTGSYDLTTAGNIEVTSADQGNALSQVEFRSSPYGVTFNRNNTAAGSYGWYLNGASYVTIDTGMDTGDINLKAGVPYASGVSEKFMNVSGAYEGILATGGHNVTQARRFQRQPLRRHCVLRRDGHQRDRAELDRPRQLRRRQRRRPAHRRRRRLGHRDQQHGDRKRQVRRLPGQPVGQ